MRWATVLLLAATFTADEPWTAEDAIVALHTIATMETTTEESRLAQVEAADAWLDRLQADEIDLGAFSYLPAVALYLQGYAKEAGDVLLAYLDGRESFPSKDFDRFTDRILLDRTVVALKSDEWEVARKAFPLALAGFEKRELVYAAVGSACVRSGKAEALAILVDVQRRLLADETLDDAARVGILRRILRVRRPGKPAVRYDHFRVETIDGRTIRKADLLDKVVLVDYWGTWCVPCRMAVPHLQRLHEKYAARGLVVIGLAYEKGPAEAHRKQVTDYLETEKVTYPMALGTPELDGAIGGVGAWPTLIFLKPGLRFDHRTVGFSPSHPAEIEAWVKKALEEAERD